MAEELLWRSPKFTRLAAAHYIRAAAFTTPDDPERANHLAAALENMCHSGHVSISDVKSIYEIAMQAREDSRRLYEEVPNVVPIYDMVGRAATFIQRLDALVESGQATPNSRLKPFPDNDIHGETRVDQIEPSVFLPGEDEADWRTPDGRFAERNSVFHEYRDSGVTGWVNTADIGPPPVAETHARRYGKDNWGHRSYFRVFQLAREEYDRRKDAASERFDGNEPVVDPDDD